MTAPSLYSKHNSEHISLSLTSLLNIMGEKWIETLKPLSCQQTVKPMIVFWWRVQTEVWGGKNGAKAWLNRKCLKGEVLFGAPTSLFCGFLSWEVLLDSPMLPLATYTRMCLLKGMILLYSVFCNYLHLFLSIAAHLSRIVFHYLCCLFSEGMNW